MEKRTQDEFMNTMYIKEIIQEFHEDESMEKLIMVFGHIMLRMKEEGVAPMAFKNPIRYIWDLDPDMGLEDVFEDMNGSDRRFVVIEDNGKKWLPLFTDRNEMADLERTNQVSEVLIREILEEAAYNDDIAGLVVNPFTDGFAVYKDGIEFMLNKVDELGAFEAG